VRIAATPIAAAPNVVKIKATRTEGGREVA
jgi:hypothetical protein